MTITVLFILTLAILSDATAQDGHTVRVRLHELTSPSTVVLSASDGAVRLYAADFENEIATLEAGRDAVLSRSGTQIHVRMGETGIFAASLRVEPSAGARFGLAAGENRSAASLRTYEGRLLVSVLDGEPGLRLINEVDLERYVAAVVSTEYGFDDLEGSKAMAVAIRTYAVGALGRFGPDYDHVDHTLSQIYQGVERITPVVEDAVRLTRGQILTYRGEPIEAVYFAASGGHTADNETVWQARALPYLRGVPDPYDTASPHASWTFRVSRDRLLSALGREFGFPVAGFVISGRSADGRVATIDLLRENGSRTSLRANDFRLLLIRHFGDRSLQSTFFDARRTGDEYVFEGRGSGHGVGLSQWGAHELSRRGTSYDEILNFYYTDVRLETRQEWDTRREGDEIAADGSVPIRQSDEAREADARPQVDAAPPERTESVWGARETPGEPSPEQERPRPRVGW